VFTEDLVYERLKFIGEFMDNLQEVLLEGLSADLDAICTYVLSKHCDATATSKLSTSPTPPSTCKVPPTNISKSYREKTTSLCNTRLFYIRKDDGHEHAIDRTTNRGRSYSVNDGHMSNVVIPGVDVEAIYRKVVRRQVELEVYYPSRDAVAAMMSRQFGKYDLELKR
jgi:hypothetical protein